MMQHHTDLSLCEPRDSLIYEATQIAQLYPELIGITRELSQYEPTTFGAGHTNFHHYSDHVSTSHSSSDQARQAYAQEQTFTVAAPVSTLGSMDHSLVLTDPSLDEDSELERQFSYAESITDVFLRHKNHGAFCRIKTACKKLFNFSKHRKATKRTSGASSANGHSRHVGPFGECRQSVNGEVSAGSNISTNELQPHSFYSRRRLSPLPPTSQDALPTTANTARDNQTRQSSRRCSFTRNLHTALLYAAHNAPPSSELSAHSDQVYPVVESLGPEDVQDPEDDFAWIGRHVFASMGSLAAFYEGTVGSWCW